jgi:hypothetical protein
MSEDACDTCFLIFNLGGNDAVGNGTSVSFAWQHLDGQTATGVESVRKFVHVVSIFKVGLAIGGFGLQQQQFAGIMSFFSVLLSRLSLPCVSSGCWHFSRFFVCLIQSFCSLFFFLLR